jgi:hypothetical protein
MSAKPPIAGRAAPTATGLSARPKLARSLYFPTGPQLQAFAAFRIRPRARHRIKGSRDSARRLRKLWEITGGEDFIIHEALPTPTPSTHFVIDRLTNRAEVAEVWTSIVY